MKKIIILFILLSNTLFSQNITTGIIASSISKEADPFLVSATVEDAAPTDIVMVFNEVVTGTNLGFTVGGTTSTTFASISGSGTNTITGVLAVGVVNGETVLLSYNDAVGDIIDGDSNPLASFTNESVINNVGVDADAQAFIDAVGTLDATNQTAINNLVVGLKTDGIWTKMIAIYPFAGSTAAEHKWNLKDPRDLDAAFRLVFSGGWTHSANGAIPNGTNGDADTFLIPNTHLSTTSAHFSFYSRTNNTTDGYDMGCSDNSGATTAPNSLIAHYSGNAYAVFSSSYSCQVTNSNSNGFYIGNRNDGTNTELFRNGSSIKVAAETVVLNTSRSVYIGANNYGGGSSSLNSDRECAFSSIGDGLTGTQAGNFYTRVQTYQTELSRQI